MVLKVSRSQTLRTKEGFLGVRGGQGPEDFREQTTPEGDTEARNDSQPRKPNF